MNFEEFNTVVKDLANKHNLQIEKIENHSPAESAILYIAHLSEGRKFSFIKGFCKPFSFYKEGSIVTNNCVLGEGNSGEEAYLDFQNQMAALTTK